MSWKNLLSFLIFPMILGCGPRTTQVVEPQVRADTKQVLARFMRYRLEPAAVAPPSIEGTPLLVVVNDISGSAVPIRAESADWNQWPGTSSRLFNNRAALLFELEITSGEAVRWVPERTRLELNHEGNLLRAAPTQEVLLEDLLFWAYHQERNVLDGDLALRARAAGPLREAYLPITPERLLTGIVAFPLVTSPENERYYVDMDPSDFHIVSMRLTVAVRDPRGEIVELVWLFE